MRCNTLRFGVEIVDAICRKHVPVDAELMRGVKMTQNVGYVPNPGTRHRNQSPYKMPTKGKTRKANVPDSPGARGTGKDAFIGTLPPSSNSPYQSLPTNEFIITFL